MTTCRHDRVLNDVRSLFELGVVSGLTDGQLLDRFVLSRGGSAETAFSALVDRHGAMVLRVCRNALANPHDVEDAFQATFLVLVRKAGSIRNRSSCGSWLHGVALRAAAEIRCSEAKRKGHEAKAGGAGEGEGSARDMRTAVEQDELRRVIDEELGRLRDRYRTPLVLCYLEGRSCEEVADQLGWPVGTVKSRLARGRERLRARLVRRGIAPALGLAVNGLPKPAMAAVPAALEARVVEAAVLVASGSAVGTISAVVGAIVGAELRGGLVNKGLKLGGLVVGMGLVATVGMLGVGLGQGSDGSKKAASEVPAPKEKKGPIYARVLDRDGKGVAGVEVRFGGWEGWRKVRADGEGRVVIPREQVEDIVNLIAQGPGELAWGMLDIREGVSAKKYRNGRGTVNDPLRLSLQPLTHKVEGTIVDGKGKGIAGARVAVSVIRYPKQIGVSTPELGIEKEGWPFGIRKTDREGHYTLMLPENANVFMKAIHPEYTGPGFSADVDTQTIDPVVLIAAGGISGTVVDAASEEPVAGVHLGAQLLDHHTEILVGGGYGATVSDAKGRFALRGLQPGVYNLLAQKVEGREKAVATAQEALRVRAGEETTADLKVIEGRRLEGVVIDSKTDLPTADVPVGCYGPKHPRSGAAVERKITDKAGHFVFYVPPGEQYVYVMDGTSFSRLSRSTVVVPEQGEVEMVRLVRETRSTAQTGMMQHIAAPDEKKEAVPAKAKGAAKEAKKAEPKAAIKEAEVRVVTGRVSDGEGKPLIGVEVYVDPNSPALFGGSRFDSAATDRDGIFVLRGLPRLNMSILMHRADDKVVSKPLAAKVDTVEFTFDPAPRVVVKADALADEPVPQELRERLTFVDLDPKGTEFLGDGPANQNDLARLPQGVRRFEGTFYKVGREMIHLRGKNAAQLPESAAGISVNARADRVEILHATQGIAKDGTEIGSYIIHYDDGTSARIPVVYGRNVTNWWVWPRISEPEVPKEARVAWKGSNDTTDLNAGLTLRLFAMTWRNPHPEKGIATIDVVSKNTECDPFLVGVTLERDKGEVPR